MCEELIPLVHYSVLLQGGVCEERRRPFSRLLLSHRKSRVHGERGAVIAVPARFPVAGHLNRPVA